MDLVKSVKTLTVTARGAAAGIDYTPAAKKLGVEWYFDGKYSYVLYSNLLMRTKWVDYNGKMANKENMPFLLVPQEDGSLLIVRSDEALAWGNAAKKFGVTVPENTLQILVGLTQGICSSTSAWFNNPQEEWEECKALLVSLTANSSTYKAYLESKK